MNSELFEYHWFWNLTEIATYRRPRGAWALDGDSKVEGALRESPQNLEFLSNIHEHFRRCVRMDVLQYEKRLKSVSLFFRAWFKFVRFFLDHPV